MAMSHESDPRADVQARLRELLEQGRRLGVSGIQQIARATLPVRVQEVLEDIGALPQDAQGVPPENGIDLAPRAPGDVPDAAHKFDLGRGLEARVLPDHIPWGYGQDRVTAMVVDPDHLFVYWEVTDAAIERARPQLGAAGTEAWLCLRIYDVTQRIFDGTNAHSYFDHRIAREDRQWFFAVGKPTSTACVEVGLKSNEGFFVRIARSGRADFPRREPVPPSTPEWLSVRTAVGEVGDPVTGAAPAPSMPAPWEPHGDAEVSPEERFTPGEAFERHWEWREVFHSEWFEDGRVLFWRGPALRTTWAAGPFVHPVESPAYVEERWTTDRIQLLHEDGRTRVVYGPWHVIIRGLGAFTERRVVATWELRCAWDAAEGVGITGGELVPAGERRVRIGASEERLIGASELVLRGASELWLRGASELRLAGASESLHAGASERRFAGASEWRAAGASDLLFGGASERLWAGGSELSFAITPLAPPAKD